jgi:hypothetical protein
MFKDIEKCALKYLIKYHRSSSHILRNRARSPDIVGFYTKDDIYMGTYGTVFGRDGAGALFYEMTFIGMQPVAAQSFRSFQNGNDSALVALDIHKSKVVEKSDGIFINVSPEIRLIDAMKDGKLFVMKADLDAISSDKAVDPEDVKPEGAVSRKSLLKLVIGMAVKGYTYDPIAKKNTAGSDIKTDLERLGVGLDAQTIRDALKEAASTLPSSNSTPSKAA